MYSILYTSRHRIADKRRVLFCRLFLAMFQFDDVLTPDADDESSGGNTNSANSDNSSTVAELLRELGYSNSQSDNVPQRDAEFFEHLFRDATVSNGLWHVCRLFNI